MTISRDELSLQARRELGKSFIELEPSAILEFYEMYFDVDQEPFRFHSGTNGLTKDIIWSGKKYFASAIEVEGFEANILGRLPRPKVTVANTDSILSNILRDYSDFRNGKFVRIRVFLKNIDNENFDENQNPFGTPNPLSYISKEKYIVSQKLIENKVLLQFELISPFDLESLETATRAIYGRYCYWQYRGTGCGYQGDLICQENDKNFSQLPLGRLKINSSKFKNGTFEETIKQYLWLEDKNYVKGDIVYISNIDFNGFKDPPRTWFVCVGDHTSSRFLSPNKSPDLWQKDGCSKTINACKKRFQSAVAVYIGGIEYLPNNDFDTVNGILPFGGFPGTDRFQYE
jgi:lambda family phage minor tail protein L